MLPLSQHVFRAVRHRSYLMSFTYLLVLALAGFAGSGCSGSGHPGNSSAGISAGGTASTRTGRATFTVRWPEPAKSRLIPRAANALRVTLLQGDRVVTQQLLTRPALGDTSTAQFDKLPEGVLRIEANAYPNADGSGVVLSHASGTVQIVLEENATVRLSLTSTIDHLAITPPADGLAVGGTGQATVAAYDAAGALVPTSPDTLIWYSDTPSIVTVGATGLLTGVAAGNATVQVSDSESQKSASYRITVSSITVNPAPRPTRWFAYFVSPYGDTSFPGINFPIRQYAVAEDGTMSPLSPPAVSGGMYGYKAVPHPNQPFVYVVNQGSSAGDGTISQFRRQNNGQLTPLNPPEISVEPYRFPLNLVFTPDGKFAYIDASNYICQFRVNADGTLAKLEPFVTKVHNANYDTTGFVMHPSGGAVFFRYGVSISVFRVGNDGQLIVAPNFHQGTEEEKLLVHPSAPYLYNYGAVSAATISQLSISSGGTVTRLTPAQVNLPRPPNTVVFDSTGKFAFATAHDMPFQTLRFSANGQLENRTDSIPGTTHRGFFCAAHPALPYLYAQPGYLYSGEQQPGDPSAESLTRFGINADGSLTPLSPAIASSVKGRGPFFVPSYEP